MQVESQPDVTEDSNGSVPPGGWLNRNVVGRSAFVGYIFIGDVAVVVPEARKLPGFGFRYLSSKPKGGKA